MHNFVSTSSTTNLLLDHILIVFTEKRVYIENQNIVLQEQIQYLERYYY
jgi:hypothetical protein